MPLSPPLTLTLSLHDSLPICLLGDFLADGEVGERPEARLALPAGLLPGFGDPRDLLGEGLRRAAAERVAHAVLDDASDHGLGEAPEGDRHRVPVGGPGASPDGSFPEGVLRATPW